MLRSAKNPVDDNSNDDRTDHFTPCTIAQGDVHGSNLGFVVNRVQLL